MPDGIPGRGVIRRRRLKCITTRIDWLQERIRYEDPAKPRTFDRAEIGALKWALSIVATAHPDLDIPKEYQE